MAKHNPVKSTSSSLMYKINPVATSSQTSVAINMVSTLEVRNRLREAITPKRVLNETVSTHALIKQVPDDEETSITVPDVYETYINSLAPGERPIPLNVTQESHALRSITMVVDNREEVEGIIDPGSQIIAMSEAVCHDIGLAYDPSIKLNMQSANGEVDQSLVLSCNVPCKINSITLYLQVHIIRSPAYDILLGRPPSPPSKTSQTRTKPSPSSTLIPNAVSPYPHYPRPLHVIEGMAARVFTL
jgi:hypothetical protein